MPEDSQAKDKYGSVMAWLLVLWLLPLVSVFAVASPVEFSAMSAAAKRDAATPFQLIELEFFYPGGDTTTSTAAATSFDTTNGCAVTDGEGPYRTRYAQLTTLNKCQTIPTLSYHTGPISPFVKLIDLSAVAGPAYKDLPATVSIVWYEDAGCTTARLVWDLNAMVVPAAEDEGYKGVCVAIDQKGLSGVQGFMVVDGSAVKPS
ncbi:uncharacterized protein AB675_1576 [Cyphellophora attinorum]|uniref:Uncharacterized protein n=1 Tax=Cyphellophora attinorum TaxID=1664694 RepID=A0A0N0NK17_9EURO|nr:uncharacterized protein AB675_1576 [Phialophora attinorum]KPI37299.1 hypothetical protein AB675_1576 [Phialophora attinorum]